jgi:AcrR family transcriptional regulator
MAKESLRELKRRRTRERILEVALEVFHRDGFSGARQAEIARLAEISDQTLLNYFPSKEALFEAVIVDWLQNQEPAAFDPAVPGEQLSIEEVFMPLLDASLEFCARYCWLLRMSAVNTDLFVPYRRSAPPSIERYYPVRLERVRELQRLQRVRADISAERICRLYQALRDHVYGSWLLSEADDVESLRRAYHETISVFVAGIRQQ